MSGPRTALGVVGLRGLQAGAELAAPHLRELGERNVERNDHPEQIEEPDVRLAALDRAT